MTECDHVIVGGGVAGCIIARRLAERTTGRIILLEAGHNDENDPVARDLSRLDEQTESYDWGFKATPLKGRELDLQYSRAKILGGCANHNDCAFLVPPDCDFETWRDLGAKGWGPSEVRPYFDRVDGRVKVDVPSSGNPISEAFVAGCRELGFPFREFRKGVEAGTGWFPLNIDGPLRQSTSAAYLHPLASLPRNLEVWTETFVERLLIEQGRCVGVETSRGTVRARREVLLTAGAIQSPQLMLVSGIGNGADLRALGISVAHHLPGVGQHLLDHVASGVVWDLKESPGPWVLTPYEATLLMRVDPDAPAPDVLFHFGLRVREKSGTRPLFGSAANGVKVAPNVARSRSEGTVRLASPDPRVAPLIDMNYLSDPDGYDLRVLTAATRFARRLAEAPALKRHIRCEIAPGPSVGDEADLVAYIREICETVYHASGTCRMGNAQDPMTVTTPDLKVRGIEGLRVCDASVFPAMVSVNIANTVMMVAEKAADLVVVAS